MKISVVATTHPNFVVPKQELDRFGGLAAGICYMANDFETLQSEDEVKTFRRAKMTKESGHHSVYDHSSISLYLHCIPRVLECMLDNERYMVSSVKSGRYTVHPLPDDEQKIYDKWRVRLEELIAKEQSKSPKFFTDSRIKKLAMENARYITGAFTMVSMMHTTTYRQLNYVYGFLRDYIAVKTTNPFEKKLRPYIVQFLKQLDATGYIDEALIDTGKFRKISLFNDTDAMEYFGDVYATSYRCSFPVFLHLHRHRTLKHHIKTPPKPDALEFYVPKLISDDADATKEWLDDLKSLRNNYPQAMLLHVTEMGNLDDFILKVIERKCSVVLLETNHVVNDLLGKYQTALSKAGHSRADELAAMQKGARCTFPNYVCSMPCAFGEAITEKRRV